MKNLFSFASYIIVQMLVAIAFAFSHESIFRKIGLFNEQLSVEGVISNIVFLLAWAYCLATIKYYRKLAIVTS